MTPLLIKLILAPVLTAGATVAGRRWGPRVGGVVAAFPAIVGPLLLVTALEHGARAAARAADGTLVGLGSLAAFAVVYAALCRSRGWALSVIGGWAAAALTQGLSAPWAGSAGWAAAGLVAAASLLAAACALSVLSPRAAPDPTASARGSILLRAAAAALLVTGLSSAVATLGATRGGMLAALPVLASLLTAFTQRESGPAAAVELLRGTVAGMAGFVAFCEVVAVAIVPLGGAVAFAAATLAALALQAPLARSRPGYPGARNSGGRSGEASASARRSPSASRSAA